MESCDDEPSRSIDNDKPFSYTSIFSHRKHTLKRSQLGYGSCRSVNEYVKIGERLGEGTYGVVYRAQDTKTGGIVALKKVIHNDRYTKNNGLLFSTIREISLLKRLKHDNIVQVFDVAVTKDTKGIFIVMESCEQDLAMYHDKFKIKLQPQEVKCIMRQFLTGLEYLHKHFVVHRDLKVPNLLLDRNGLLKIADFGLARIYGDPDMNMTPNVVTVWYRSPELLLHTKNHTSAVDMWSVACIMVELLIDKPVLPGRSEVDQLMMIIDLLGTPTTKIWPELNQMPHMEHLTLKEQPYNNLGKMMPNESAAAVGLLNEMFAYDPKKRISATAALKHEYFMETPYPCAPADLPVYLSDKKPKRSIVTLS